MAPEGLWVLLPLLCAWGGGPVRDGGQDGGGTSRDHRAEGSEVSGDVLAWM